MGGGHVIQIVAWTLLFRNSFRMVFFKIGSNFPVILLEQLRLFPESVQLRPQTELRELTIVSARS